MKLPAIILSQGEVQRFNEAIDKEWLVTNGIGGYASSTVLGLNTRKYHVLPVAALHPPANRTVCLSKLIEEIATNGAFFPIISNEFPNTADVEMTICKPQEKNEMAALYKVKTKNQKAIIRITPC